MHKWDASLLDDLPSMIGHELNRAARIAQTDDYYSLMLQIKDCYEILIKTLALVILSECPPFYDELDAIHADHWIAYHQKAKSGGSPIAKESLVKFQRIVTKLFAVPEFPDAIPSDPTLADYDIETLIEYLHYRHCVARMLGKNLSLGDWVELLEGCGKLNSRFDTPKKLAAGLLGIIKEEKKGESFNLVRWRNDEIGHGALKLYLSSSEKAELKEKLDYLWTYISDYQKEFGDLQFYYAVEGSEEQPKAFRGPDATKKLDHESYRLYVGKEGGAIVAIQVEPLIQIDGHGLFLFDSFHPWKRIPYAIDYPNGTKCSGNEKLQGWCKDKNAKYGQPITVHHSIKSELISGSAMKLMEDIVSIAEYEEPVYLKDAVLSYTAEKEKGVLLFAVDRGMGKSVFAKAMDQTVGQPPDLLDREDFHVGVIYANGFLMYNQPLFFQRLPTVMLRDNYSKDFSLQYNTADKPEQHRANVASYLNHVKHLVAEDKKLILLIDGLDEIPGNEKQSLLSCIPSAGLLEDGVYVILTARNKEEARTWDATIFEKIDELVEVCGADVKRYTIENEEYIGFIEKYIAHNGKLVKADAKAALLQGENKRMTYLAMLLHCLTLDDSIDLSDNSMLLSSFLRIVGKRSGNNPRYMKMVKELLALFTVYDEPLTLEEISYLLPGYHNDFELVGTIYDLGGFIRIYRSEDEKSRFGLSHYLWKDQIDVSLAQELRALRQSLLSLMPLVEAGGGKETVLGNLLLFSTLKNLLKSDPGGYDAHIHSVFSVAQAYEALPKVEEGRLYHELRYIRLYEVIEAYVVRTIQDERPHGEEFLTYAYALARYLRRYVDEEGQKKTERYFLLLLSICEKEKKMDEELYVQIKNSYGLLLLNQKREEESFVLFQDVCRWYEESCDIPSLPFPSRLHYYKCYANQALAKRNWFFKNGDSVLLEEAYAIQSKIVDSKAAIQEEALLSQEGDSLAFTLHSRGLTSYYLGIMSLITQAGFTDFESLCKDAFQCMRRLKGIGMVHPHSDHFMRAMQDFEASIRIFDSLSGKGIGFKELPFGSCCAHYGDLMLVTGQKEKAILLYDKMLESLESQIKVKKSGLAYRVVIYSLVNLIDSGAATIKHRNLLKALVEDKEMASRYQLRESYTQWLALNLT